MDLEQRQKDLLFEMKVTKGSRFNAADRLNRRDRTWNKSVAYASAGVILLTVSPTYFHVSEFANSCISLLTVGLSLVILAASLVQYSSADPVRAEQHHRCAMELNSLRRELRVQDQITPDLLASFTRRYDDILQRYGTNHEAPDFERYKQEHQNEFPSDDLRSEPKGRREQLEPFQNIPGIISSIVIGALMAAAFSGTSLSRQLWMDLVTWLYGHS